MRHPLALVASLAGVRVELRGDRAIATLDGVAANRLRLVRTGERWLIDELGVPTG
jgi:hypothetical protein